MTDQELLQAIGQVVEAKIEPVRQDIRDLKEQVGPGAAGYYPGDPDVRRPGIYGH